VIEAPKEAFPLTWPITQPRTPPAKRRRSKFKVTFGDARSFLLAEVDRLGGYNAILSTNVPLRRDGLPYADGDPGDPGAAIYFKMDSKPYVIACDSYESLRENVRALGLTIEALRTIERHGSTSMMEQAFTGFLALPPPRPLDPPWWESLGVEAHTPTEQVRAARQVLIEQHHPDRGGDHDVMAQINRAWDTFCKERGL
jgi:hypothetical protein